MAASLTRTVHSKTQRVFPIHTRNIGPIGPLSSTIPSPWIVSLPKGRSDMPCKIQRATVPGTWLRPNYVWYIPKPTGSVLFTQEILDPSVQYPVLFHHLESSHYPKAGLICHAWFIELLCQENGGVPITYGKFQDPQGLSYPHKKYWTHRSIIQYYTIALNRVLTQRQVWYAMHDSKSYCTRKMAVSQSHMVHSKTHRVCPIHTRNIGPIGPYQVIYYHLESSPYAKAGMTCHAWFKELLYQQNGCVPITYGTFQIPDGLSFPQKKYWTHRSIIQYYYIAFNRVLTQRQVSYAMHD